MSIADWHDHIFAEGKAGDWCWSDLVVDGEPHRCLLIVVPSNRGQGALGRRGLELINIFPSHAEGNWAQPGNINGWDGNVEAPTLEPSIHVRGKKDNPGWHGYFRRGRLETV